MHTRRSAATASAAAAAAVASGRSGLAPADRVVFQRRLVPIVNPVENFYKDEGGKGNCMTMEVKLEEYNAAGDVLPPRKMFDPVPLALSLYFESEERVEDKDQSILRMMGQEYEAPSIDPATRIGVLKFRLEKVSRRKDGQRFKIRVEVDCDRAVDDLSDIRGCYSTPICVLSKRKLPQSGSRSKRRKTAAGGLVSDLSVAELRGQIVGVSSKLDQVLDLMRTQSRRVMQLEAKMAEVSSFMARAAAAGVGSSPAAASSAAAAMAAAAAVSRPLTRTASIDVLAAAAEGHDSSDAPSPLPPGLPGKRVLRSSVAASAPSATASPLDRASSVSSFLEELSWLNDPVAAAALPALEKQRSIEKVKPLLHSIKSGDVRLTEAQRRQLVPALKSLKSGDLMFDFALPDSIPSPLALSSAGAPPAVDTFGRA
eukprot:PLAT7386.1.p1 GENE.PLAT7386.1~~PLAT7386.1.p1  ORF type:complete len:427 (+),score=197.76 PLAT7386.1:71-1351(+)